MEQYIESLNIMILCFNSMLATSKLLQQLLEYIQIESGLDSPVLLSHCKSFHVLCIDGQLRFLQRNLDHYNFQLYLPSQYYLTSLIMNDKTINRVVLTFKQFNTKQRMQINLVRIKLQVIFVSNLLEPRSNRIKDCYQKGKKDKLSKSELIQPEAQLSKQTMKIWNQFL